MAFLSELLERAVNEKPMVLIVTGYPAPDARVPRLSRKPLGAITTFRWGGVTSRRVHSGKHGGAAARD